MQHEEQKLKRRAPTMLFAMLLTLLIGGAGSAAATPGPASFKALQGSQAGDVVRSLRRVADDDLDADELVPLSAGAAPAVETVVLSRRPAAQAAPAPSVFQARLRPTPFRARAPPAS